MYLRRVLYVVLWLFLLAACESFEPAAPAENNLLDGPVNGLSEAENRIFLRGDVAFNNEIFTPATGLGPVFVATSCGSCHAGDGKGHPFTTLTRFGQIDASGNQYLSLGGPQLQHQAIPGFNPEQIPVGATFSKILPPANTGLGFLDAVTDADILEREDPLDTDADGISGVANWINLKNYVTPRPNSVTHFGRYIGRFGKKASTYDLLQQTAQAYNQDIGITSALEPIDTYSGLATDPEVTDQTINDVVLYLKTLKAPQPRESEATLEGKILFQNMGCEKCHRADGIFTKTVERGCNCSLSYCVRVKWARSDLRAQ